MMFKYLVVAAAIISLTACGGGGKKNAAAPSASPATGTYGQSNASANNAPGTAEPVPAGMNCGGTQPVWANERSRVFHLAGDPYYGRTKHGKYMCERDAAKAGYRPSKS
jgi:hypothetical protein